MFGRNIVMKPMGKVPGGIQSRLQFNDLELSIIQHEGSYGGSSGLYEIGVFDSTGGVELPGVTEDGDTVKGFLTEKEVAGIITKMICITGTDPVEIV